MNVTLTKKKLLSILAREPLAPGTFVTKAKPEWDEKGRAESVYGDIKNKECIGCAVGQLFRNLITSTTKASEINSWCSLETLKDTTDVSSNGDSKAHMIAGRFLAALSVEFERACVKYHARGKVIRSPNHPVKKAVFKFVNEKFPPTITLNLNGFKLRRGVKADPEPVADPELAPTK